MHIETDSKSCCGCTACMSVCPANAIKMISDSEGFYIPQTDGKNCIECGACESKCPYELPIIEMLKNVVNTLEK